MNKKCQISPRLYESVLDKLNDIHLADTRGRLCDFAFYYDDLWLTNSVVVENIDRKRGEWEIHLVFAEYNNPLKLMKRKITAYSCLKKATLTASLMRRLAAKDQRGTLILDVNTIRIASN